MRRYINSIFKKNKNRIASVILLFVCLLALPGCTNESMQSNANGNVNSNANENAYENAYETENEDENPFLNIYAEESAEQPPSETVQTQTGAEQSQTGTGQAGLPSDNSSDSTTINENGFFQVHYIDIGQGDCTLIGCDDEWMLIDAGDDSKGTAVQLYLMKHNVKELKYFIVTHSHADHAGGADVIITKYDIGTFITPDLNGTTKEFEQVVQAMKYRNLANTTPVAGDVYELGSAKFVILGPVKQYEEENNKSVVVKVIYGNNSFLFCGDTEAQAENDMVSAKANLKADVIKIGHHGSNTSTSETFIDKVKPVYAVISVGANNSYHHPSSKCLNTLKSRNIKVFRTDEQGSIVCESDGNNLTWNCLPSETWQSGEDFTTEDSAVENAVYYNNSSTSDHEELLDLLPQDEDNNTVGAYTYVLNTNTKKFHYTYCNSVDQMKEKNRQYTTMSREEIIANGYSPCGNCHP